MMPQLEFQTLIFWAWEKFFLQELLAMDLNMLNCFQSKCHLYPEHGGSCSLEMLVPIYQTTQRHILEDHSMNLRCCENVRSYVSLMD
jgi:hypothetical protein